MALYSAATNSCYVAIFHAARALLFRDGIRQKSHFCLEQYLNTFVTSGKLEPKWITFFASMRDKRDTDQYGFQPPPTSEEIESSVQPGRPICRQDGEPSEYEVIGGRESSVVITGKMMKIE